MSQVIQILQIQGESRVGPNELQVHMSSPEGTASPKCQFIVTCAKIQVMNARSSHVKGRLNIGMCGEESSHLNLAFNLLK